MHRPRRGETARGLVVGSVCGTGAVVAHAVSADGHVDAATALAVVLAGLAGGRLLARRPGPVPAGTTVVVALGLQLVAHLAMALSVTGPTVGHAAPAVHGAHTAHPGHDAAVLSLADGGTPMLLAHLGIAVLTTLLARRADAALLSLLADRLFPSPLSSSTVVPADEHPPHRCTWWSRSSDPVPARRGPVVRRAPWRTQLPTPDGPRDGARRAPPACPRRPGALDRETVMTTTPVRTPTPDVGPPPPPPQSCPPRRSIRPLLLRLHFYAAVLAAPFLLVAALSGGLYALSPQIEQVIHADQLSTDSRGTPLTVGQQVEAVRSVQPTLPLLAVRPGDGTGETTRVLLDDGRTDESRRLAVFVDPVTGELLGEETAYGGSGALPVRTWIGELHRHLHLGEPGRIYSELAASWLGVVAVAGLGLWLTGRRAGPRLRPQRAGSPRRRTLSLHGAVGTWAALGFVMLSVTGLTWSTYAGANVSEVRAAWGWTAPAVVSEVSSGTGGPASAGEGHAGHGGDVGASTFIPVDSLGVGYQSALDAARAEGLDGPVEVTGPATLSGTYVVSQIDSTWPTRGDVTSVDPATGEVVDTVRFDDVPLMAKLAAWGIDLHMGVLFGWVSAIAMSGLALGLVLMVVTGYRAWWLRRPTRGHRLRMGRAARRGAWRSLPPVGTGLLVAVVLAAGWFLPVLGLSLVVFLLVDLVVGLGGRRRRSPSTG